MEITIIELYRVEGLGFKGLGQLWLILRVEGLGFKGS